MRKKRADKKRLIPDPRYNDFVVSQLINYIMQDGKKNTARKIVYDAFDIIGKRSKQEPLEVFKKGVMNVAPVLEVRSRRVGGATYQVPVDVRETRRIALALRWITKFASSRREQTMAGKLAAEIMSAANEEGASVKKREDTHRMAEANKAFAHFRW